MAVSYAPIKYKVLITSRVLPSLPSLPTSSIATAVAVARRHVAATSLEEDLSSSPRKKPKRPLFSQMI